MNLITKALLEPIVEAMSAGGLEEKHLGYARQLAAISPALAQLTLVAMLVGAPSPAAANQLMQTGAGQEAVRLAKEAVT